VEITAWRLMDDLAALDRIGRTETGLRRVAWTPAFAKGLDWLAGRFAEGGLRVERDAAANLWGWWDVGSGPALVLGSHIDTVPDGGTYDGAFGVLAALEAVRTLREAGDAPAFPLAVVAWADEEGARFGAGFFGSRAFVGEPITETFVALAGEEARAALREGGVDTDRLGDVAAGRGRVGAYLEAHIEQGPRLEAAGVPLGVVSGIYGIARTEWTLTGAPRHAGTTPFSVRRDAGIGAARATLVAREIALAAGENAVGTVGTMRWEPNAANIVPGRAVFFAEFRALDGAVLAEMEAAFSERMMAICAEERLTAESRTTMHTPPTPLHPALIEALVAGCGRVGVEPLHIPSGAGHDAGILAPLLPAAMLFVPSRDGISHAPDEYTAPADLATGANALLETARVLMERGLPRS